MPTLNDENNAVKYALVEQKKLPLHDVEHVKMAANAINSIKGITDEERIAGRIVIVEEAASLGISVKAAQKMHLHFESMALEMPDTPDHPNKLPFSGVLTRLDVASNFPVGGTTGKKVIIPTAVAEKALPTLLGMGVDCTSDLSGHDRKFKIGVITEAFIGIPDAVLGTPLHIAGFFYAADFPTEVIAIQAQKELLGFSYEAEAFVESMLSDPWVCSSCDFTGAAVLYKDKAAFTATSLQASKGEIMTPEEIAAMQAENTRLAASAAALQAQLDEQVKVAAASVHSIVKPHADAMRTCASAMTAAGIGADATSGHAAILNKMADHIEAQSMLGKIPSTFDSYYYGAAQVDIAAEVKKALDAHGAATKIAVEAAGDAAAIAAIAAAGKRQSLSASDIVTMKKIGLGDETAAKLTVTDVDAACRKAGLSTQSSIALKLNLRASGALA